MNLPFYSENDVKKAVSMSEAISAMREAFISLSNELAIVPNRINLPIKDQNALHLSMPAYIKGGKYIMIKLVNVHFDNPKNNLPLINGVILMMDAEKGTPLALIDGKSVTALRTGASSGLATELLSKKTKSKNNEVMLIFNKKLSVAPLTTHISISQVKSKLKKQKIINKIKVIDSFYKKNLNKRPKIAVLGLNPHNFSTSKKSEEKKIIIPAIKSFKKSKIKVIGPISPDSSFINSERKKFDVILGMYHDQVLTPFKALYNFRAINITLGLPYIRVSPDHGVGENIMGKKIANADSLIESIKFFNYIK